SLARGPGAGLSASAGILAANAVYFALSATSLGAVLIASWQVFAAIKWVGAGYLVWLGARMIFGVADLATPAAPTAGPQSLGRSLGLGLLTQGANPKALIFFTAILPQFIDASAPVLSQVLILGVSSVVIEFIVLSVYVGT